ncbi:lysosomal alpha-glucosidase [Elysia marginata]|uniref:Lysosomal alpha-glucosidase n=1 Tax=Elysia marginata TaxID=1093978 RepID=A0AAV4ISV4_9GAST|nr:lysosomal alpha-glucosidase [Elysia marginata]
MKVAEKFSISKSQVGRIKQSKESLRELQQSPSVLGKKRKRDQEQNDVGGALAHWMTDKVAQGARLSGHLLKKKATELAASKVWPDFIVSNQTGNYWTKIAADFHTKVPFDGMWLDMNEISNFVDGSISGCDNTSTYNNPPYLPGVAGGSLYKHTICPSARHGKCRNYDVHNLYGMAETAVSYRTLKIIHKKRPFIISRSTYPGQGHYGGHWSGDNSATFYDMYKSISAMLHANMFGIPMTGSDICGFHLNTSSELCTRWHQLGAFYGFSRNHNADDCLPQDPGQFDAESVASTRRALRVRYSLLPFLYTLMWRSHVYGETVARPLLFEFPEDPVLENLDTQFMWGAALLISPVLTQGARSVQAYFPGDVWYDFYTGWKLEIQHGRYVELSAELGHINLHMRGGHVIPMQQPGLSTTLSRKNRFQLLVSLDVNMTAVGELYWDDGDSIDVYESGEYNLLSFEATKNGLKSSVKHIGYLGEPMILGNVTVMGLSFTPSNVTMDGNLVTFSFKNSVLYISNLAVVFTETFEIVWH